MNNQSTKNTSKCLQKAFDDEPIFVLLARDCTAPRIVRKWAAEQGGSLQPLDKVIAAMTLANEMETWYGINWDRKKNQVYDAAPAPEGTEEGDLCARGGCCGRLEFHDPENCSCHLKAPCSSCTDVTLFCHTCGWEACDDPAPLAEWQKGFTTGDDTVESLREQLAEANRRLEEGKLFVLRQFGPVSIQDIIQAFGFIYVKNK